MQYIQYIYSVYASFCSAGLSECGVNVTWPLNVTFRQVKASVAGKDEPQSSHTVPLAESVLHLIRRNPHWGIRWVGVGGCIDLWVVE